MTFVSHAQNFEDVLLRRALRDVPQGRYLDVGAQHPVYDSVSLAFYELGWRGTHVEASPTYAGLLRQHRPDETVIEAAVSSAPGLLTFHEFPETGLSTGIESIAAGHVEGGFKSRALKVPTITLAALLDDLATGGDIHWLKLDVEGMEADALQSWGECPVRPWVLVIESTYPNSQQPTEHEWQNHVLRRGYQEVYFDGLNRFYLAKGHEDRAPAFSAPPNVFDDFAAATHHFVAREACASVQAERLREVEQTRDDLNAERARIETEYAQALDHERQRLSGLMADAARARESESLATARVQSAEGRIAELQAWAAERERNADARVREVMADLDCRTREFLREQVQGRADLAQAQTTLEFLTGQRDALADEKARLEQRLADELARARASAEIEIAALRASLAVGKEDVEARLTEAARNHDQELRRLLGAHEDERGAWQQAAEDARSQLDRAAAEEQAARDVLNAERARFSEQLQAMVGRLAQVQDQLALETRDRRDGDRQARARLADLEATASRAEAIAGQRAEEVRLLGEKLNESQRELDTLRRERRQLLRAEAAISAAPEHHPATPETPVDHSSGANGPPVNLGAPATQINMEPDMNTAEHRNPYLRADSLEELCQFNDVDFVRCAYVTILGRQPDPSGEAHYTGLLRDGWSKLTIVRYLRTSGEGEWHDPGIAGLDRRLRRQHTANRSPLRWVLRPFLRGIEVESPRARRQRAADQRLARIERQLGHAEWNRKIDEIQARVNWIADHVYSMEKNLADRLAGLRQAGGAIGVSQSADTASPTEFPLDAHFTPQARAAFMRFSKVTRAGRGG